MELMVADKQGPVAVLTWRHEEQNRFNTPFVKEMLEFMDHHAADDSTTAVVITSDNPKFFSTGLYLDWMIGQEVSRLREFLELLHRLLITFTGYPKPVIAAINGHAVAAGMILAACVDFRLMNSERGFVRLPEVQIDIPFWPGMTAVLKEVMGERSYREMAYTGERFTAAQALSMGYIDKIVPPDQLLPQAIEMAIKLGTANTATYTAIKLVNRAQVLRIMREEDPLEIEKFIARMNKGQ